MKRKLKVYEQSNSYKKYESVPTIILKGKYLNEFNFYPNSKIQVELQKDKIIITKIDN